MGDKKGSEQSREVFRQFAWNLAGTLAKPVRRASKPKSSTTVSAGKT